jgi:hypothetical protein
MPYRNLQKYAEGLVSVIRTNSNIRTDKTVRPLTKWEQLWEQLAPNTG